LQRELKVVLACNVVFAIRKYSTFIARFKALKIAVHTENTRFKADFLGFFDSNMVCKQPASPAFFLEY